jgi:flagellar protein FlaG
MSMEPVNTISGTLLPGTPGSRTPSPAPTTPQPAADAPASAPSQVEEAERARQAVADANRQLAQKASELTFEFDENSSRVIVKLVDKQTGQVLRQIPSKEALEIARALQDESSGALLRTDA